MSEETTFKTSIYEETKIVETDSEPSVPDLPLVTFDLNFRTLQDFLSKLAAAVNKNSLLIRNLQEEIMSKVAFRDVLGLVERVNSVMPAEFTVDTVKSNDFNDLVANLTAGTQKMCEKVQELQDFKSSAEDEIRNIWSVLNRKVSYDEFENERRNIGQEIDERLKKKVFISKYQKLKRLIKKQEDSSSKFSELTDKTISELRTEMLWKTNDIERLLQTRVNEQFVWDALEVLETKLKKQRDIQASLKLSHQQSLFEKFQSELRKLEESINQDLLSVQNSSSDSHKHLMTQIAELEISSNQKHDQINSFLNNAFIPYDSKISENKEKIQGLETTLNELKPKVPDNIESNILKVFEEVDNIKKELEFKVEREMITGLIDSVKSLKQPATPNPVPDLNDLWKLREQTIKNFERVDKEIEKIIRVLDLKAIKRPGKVRDDAIRDGFGTVGQRLLALERNQEAIFKEIERLGALIQRIVNTLEEMSNQSGLALISKKPLVGNCLSCGRGEATVIPTVPHVQGLDGRFYKADLSSFRPAATSSDWKPEDLDSRSKSPISLNRLPRAGLNSILGKDLLNSLSSSSIHRPSSAKK